MRPAACHVCERVALEGRRYEPRLIGSRSSLPWKPHTGKARRRHRQIDNMLRERPWHEVAEFASFCAQSRSLNFVAWQTVALCVIASDLDGDHQRGGDAAARLLERMAKPVFHAGIRRRVKRWPEAGRESSSSSV